MKFANFPLEALSLNCRYICKIVYNDRFSKIDVAIPNIVNL